MPALINGLTHEFDILDYNIIRCIYIYGLNRFDIRQVTKTRTFPSDTSSNLHHFSYKFVLMKTIKYNIFKSF